MLAFIPTCPSSAPAHPTHLRYVGIGGAILKYRLVDRGEADKDTYLPWIWTGFSLSITFFLGMTALVYVSFRRFHAGTTASPAQITMSTTGGPTKRASYSRSSLVDDSVRLTLMPRDARLSRLISMARVRGGRGQRRTTRNVTLRPKPSPSP